jgi:O-antigen/teichoic acid export membrane protein
METKWLPNFNWVRDRLMARTQLKMVEGEVKDLNDRGHAGELRILARGGLVSLIGSISSSLLGFGFVVIIGRTLSIRQAGGLFEAITIFTIFSYGSLLGADWGLLKMMPIFSGPRDRHFLSTIAICPAVLASVAIAAVIFLEATPIATLVIHHGSVVTVAEELRILAPFLPLATVITITSAGVRVWSVEQSIFVQSLLVPAGRLILMGAFVVLGVSPFLGAISFAVPLAIGAMVGAALLLSHLGSPIRGEKPLPASIETFKPRRRIFVEFWKFSGIRSIAGVVQILLLYLDIVLLGILGSSKQVASYTVASRYILIGTFGLTSVGYAIAPQLSRLWAAGKTEAAHTVYRESSWWIMAISWPVLLLMALFAPLLMSLFSQDYRTGAVALEILALAMLANTGTGNNSIAILMAGRNSTNLLIGTVAVILNVALNIVLIPRFGPTGAAYAWSVSILFTAVAASLVLFRTVKIHPFGSGYWAVAFSAIASYGVLGTVVRFVLGATWTSGVIVVVFGSAFYLASLVVFNRRDWLDLHELQMLLARD